MIKVQKNDSVDLAIGARKSVRAFLPDLVPVGCLDEILSLAARAPSGGNLQPWRVHVVRGETLKRLTTSVCNAFDQPGEQHTAEYEYYPTEFFEPYLSRRRKAGLDMYSLLHITKGDRTLMQEQHRRNFTFFDAPVGLIFTIDRRFSHGSLLDYGMFLQTLMLAAESRGLATCAQAAWLDYHSIIADVLELPKEERLVCGIALGYEDTAAVVNHLYTERAVLHDFVDYHN